MISSNFKVQSSKLLIGAFFLLLTAYCSLLTVNAQNDGSQQNITGRAGTFAITNARIITVSGAVIDSGTIVIRNGKIEAVGTSAQIPSGAERIDGKGLSVFPGMIDAATNLGLVEIPLGVPGTVDTVEAGDMNPNAKAITAINPHSTHINVTRINGITTVMSMPAGGIVSGQSAIINLSGSTQAEMAIVPTFGLVINFPRITTFAGFGQAPIDFNEAIRRRDQRMEDLKKIFRAAQNYASIRESAAKDKTLPTLATDLKLEAMIPYVRGEKPIIFAAERDRDIRGVVKFVEEMKVKGIIMGGQDAWKVATELNKNNIPVIYTNIYNLPVQIDDDFDYLFNAPAKMAEKGVKFCISTGDGGAEIRDLPYQAGLASAYGLSKEDALKSVTLYPAQILGIADKLGSLEAGKIANVVVTDGDILQPRTNIKYLFINGRMMPLTSRHTELFEQFKDRK